jgi:hypothetical protein
LRSTFENISYGEIAALRDNDVAIEAIHALQGTGRRISFPWLRANAGRNRNLWGQLGHGTAVLRSTAELDQYLYSYGPMVECQWQSFAQAFTLTGDPVRLVDYGCGQGLAGLLMFDFFGQAFASILAQVVLVEESDVALVRAEAVYQSIAPGCPIHCVKKELDALTSADLLPDEAMPTIHVFSNVLDIATFDHFRLLGEMLTAGTHSLLVVSHDRDFDGGTPRISDLKAALEDPAHAASLVISASSLVRFRCGPNEKYPVAAWYAKIEVSSE